jgi:hypothetical protein
MGHGLLTLRQADGEKRFVTELSGVTPGTGRKGLGWNRREVSIASSDPERPATIIESVATVVD